ncbi:MAG: RNA polymerase factor sigma-54 [Gammaproteobacteria bacterium]
MKPSLQLKLSQHLALTPQLQQSIRLLQLSTLELNQELEQALADNPLLERLDDPLLDCVRLTPSGALDAQRPPATDGPAEHSGAAEPGAPAPGDSATPDPDRFDDSAWDAGSSGEASADWGGEFGPRANNDEGDEEREWPELSSVGNSLRDHLMAQLGATRNTVRDRALVTLLIHELNDDGMLLSSLDEIAAALPGELEIEANELSSALKMLQSFDPAGVGARDLRECLTLQLDRGNFASWAESVVRTARRIVAGHLETLGARDYARLKRALRCDDDMLRDAQALIRQLDPRPGARFGGEAPTYIVPDVVVHNTRAGWVAALNSEVMPRLRINEMYAQILRANRGGHSAPSGQLQEARWLVKNIQQRFDTILRVSQAIVDRQQAFLSHGEVAMRPLVLRDIAEALELHESTVSRVTTQKYMLTPFGTLELKYFFGSHVATDSGGEASSTAIRALIRQLVSEEDRSRPLSDSRIAELLAAQGMVVARRTVAKYRDALKIPAVAQRRSL